MHLCVGRIEGMNDHSLSNLDGEIYEKNKKKEKVINAIVYKF